MNIATLHHLFLENPNACTDTRKIAPKCIFFALKGENFNGNTFASQALQKGAAYAVVDESQYAVNDQLILVPDVLETLQRLSTFHRNHNKAKVIALTGSNGKTTTKELIHAVLSKKYRTIATQGNLNNHIGVPLTLLSIQEDSDFAVVEMGANHPGEIAFLAELAQPDYGYITNFGKAHLEGFGSLEGVIQAKTELYTYLISHNRSIFLNADDPVQHKKLTGYMPKIGYSTSNGQFFIIRFLGAQPYVSLEVEGKTIETRLIGGYNFTNCGAAVLVGKYFNVSLAAIKEALESYIPSNNRSQWIKKDKYNILLDAYNANPNSMKAALENFSTMEGALKIVFLGDMFELGKTAPEEHQHIADLAGSLQFDTVFLIGENFSRTDSPLRKFSTYEELSGHLRQNSLPKGSVLIKGSRGMALERIVDQL